MRKYDIYSLVDEVAAHYIGKEELIFQLFKDAKYNNHLPKDVIDKQIDYITQPISAIKIDQAIKKEFYNHPNYKYKRLSHELMLPKGQAVLKVYETYLTIQSTGDIETETLFFEVLRKIDDGYLAMDYQNNHYGWLKPRREQNVDLRKRIVVL